MFFAGLKVPSFFFCNQLSFRDGLPPRQAALVCDEALCFRCFASVLPRRFLFAFAGA